MDEVKQCEASREEAGQLQVQLAGCSAAASGIIDGNLKPGDYGWSVAYRDKVPANGGNLSSLCWDCANAYANRCFAVPFDERTWVKRCERRLTPKGIEVWKVLECERFGKDESREG